MAVREISCVDSKTQRQREREEEKFEAERRDRGEENGRAEDRHMKK